MKIPILNYKFYEIKHNYTCFQRRKDIVPACFRREKRGIAARKRNNSR